VLLRSAEIVRLLFLVSAMLNSFFTSGLLDFAARSAYKSFDLVTILNAVCSFRDTNTL
jgi:hypothetical protein